MISIYCETKVDGCSHFTCQIQNISAQVLHVSLVDHFLQKENIQCNEDREILKCHL